MVDFLGVYGRLAQSCCQSPNISGEPMTAPTKRAPCGGGYGDGGQHEQSLWLAGAYSGPDGTGSIHTGRCRRLMMAALQQDGPCLPTYSVGNPAGILNSGRHTVVGCACRGAKGPSPRMSLPRLPLPGRNDQPWSVAPRASRPGCRPQLEAEGISQACWT
jgi:hypothetical protein